MMLVDYAETGQSLQLAPPEDGLVDAEVVPVPFKDPKKQIPLGKQTSWSLVDQFGAILTERFGRQDHAPGSRAHDLTGFRCLIGQSELPPRFLQAGTRDNPRMVGAR